MSQVRILSSRLSLTKCSKAFFILNENTEKRPYRIRSAMSAPSGEKVARTPPSANVAACKEDTRRVRLEGESCHPDYSSLKRVSFFILNGNTEKRPHRIRSAMSAPTGEKVARTPPPANAAACKEDTRRVRLEGESCHPDYSSLKRVSFFILNENTEKRPHRIRSAMSAPTGEKVARTPPSANEPPA